jgi:hypothetical protein
LTTGCVAGGERFATSGCGEPNSLDRSAPTTMLPEITLVKPGE